MDKSIEALSCSIFYLAYCIYSESQNHRKDGIFQILEAVVEDTVAHEQLSRAVEHQYNITLSTLSLSTFSENCVAHIAGYVGRKLAGGVIKCDDCKDALQSSEGDPLPAEVKHLINNRNFGGLTVPSKSLFTVCKVAEKVMKLFIAANHDGCKIKNPREIIKCKVLHEFIEQDRALFPGIRSHLFDTEYSIQNHYTTLIRSITHHYVTLKLFLFTKQVSDSSMGIPIRHSLTKQIQFRHQ